MRARLAKPSPPTDGLYPPYLPNKNSKLATPASLLIDYERSRQGIVRRWDWKRYIRLAKFLQYTPAELASTINMPHWTMLRSERDNCFSGTTALLLTMLEYTVMKEHTTDVVKVTFGVSK